MGILSTPDFDPTKEIYEMTTFSQCRWGILGTASIAQKNWHAIFHAENAQLVAVASREARRAQAFIDACQSQVPHETPPLAVGSYDELLKSDRVDAIYIPLPTGIRKEWVVRAAKAGKHVLVEKPCAVNATDLAEMIEACRENRVQFMDGVMFMHSQRMDALRQVIHEQRALGDVLRIATQFSFHAPDRFLQENIRVSSELEPLGCLGDLGWYTIRIILWLMDYQMPRRVQGRLIAQSRRPDSSHDVPLAFSADLDFDQGVTASFYCSFQTEHQQWVSVSGTKGHLRIDDFVLPFFGSELSFEVLNSAFQASGCMFNMEPHRRQKVVAEYSNNHVSAQETRMIQTFSDLVLRREISDHWPQIALQTQQVMDECLASAKK